MLYSYPFHANRPPSHPNTFAADRFRALSLCFRDTKNIRSPFSVHHEYPPILLHITGVSPRSPFGGPHTQNLAPNLFDFFFLSMAYAQQTPGGVHFPLSFCLRNFYLSLRFPFLFFSGGVSGERVTGISFIDFLGVLTSRDAGGVFVIPGGGMDGKGWWKVWKGTESEIIPCRQGAS